jgi:hypothetical protein
MKKKTLNKVYYIFLSACLFSSCYEPVDDCLDRRASNYNVAADDACDDCCTYPDFRIQFMHVWDSIPVGTNDTFLDVSLNPFVLNQFEYFISEVVLTDENDNEIRLLNNIIIPTTQEMSTVANDFQHISLSRGFYNFGPIISESDITDISFIVGVRAQNLIFTELEDDFILNTFGDSLYLDGAFLDWQLRLQRDTMGIDAIDIDGTAGAINEFTFERPITVTAGVAIDVGIEVDFSILLDGVDVQNDTEETIASKLTNNLINTFN